MFDVLDEIDIHIVDLLQENGRMHRNEIAEKIELSLPAASERLRKLEEKGIIKQYTAILDHKKLGCDVTAYIFVQLDKSTHYQNFIHKATAHPEILECHAVTGDGSHLLKVRTKNTETLEKLLSLIQSWQGVTGTRTSVVLSSPKESTQLSLKHLK
ncbi:MAG TPA: Lrp/AsnC family transcriptional regulator [Candidatus Kapabacteria bacterium]|nr:Lrp/AsnC family transcriptional regulator [Candidatus Kapabacteria bacterium]